MSRSSPREKGTVLVLAMMLATGTILFGMSYVSTAVRQSSRGGQSLDRFQAMALAEGASERALRNLMDGDSNAATDISLGSGKYSHQVRSESGGYLITGIGYVNAIEVHSLIRVEAETNGVTYPGPLYVAGSVGGSFGDVTWTEPLGYDGSFSPVANGPIQQHPSITPTLLDAASFVATDTRSSLTLATGVHTGHYYTSGNATLRGGVTLNGSVFADQSIDIQGQWGDVTLNATDGTGVLFIKGNLNVWNVESLVVNGSIFVEGSASISNVNRLEITGALVINGILNINLDAGTPGTIQLDPDLAVLGVPAAVTAGPSGVSSIREKWRRFDFAP